MKKISCFLLGVLVGAFAADADAKSLTSEIRSGLDKSSGYNTFIRTQGPVRVRNNIGDYTVNTVVYQDVPDAGVMGAGEMGHEVFYDEKPVTYDEDDDYRLFIPASMYMRMGGGMNLGFATKKVHFEDEEYSAKDSWNLMIALGWNLSSYVRTEIEFQRSVFRFTDLAGKNAYYNMFNGMIYFDLARRYVQYGDITYRRTIVPFIGLGVGGGMYGFNGGTGANGLTVAAPRAEFGLNFMITDMIGIDVYYQYQMMIEHGFGWNVARNGVDGISNILAAFRVNF